MIYALTSLLITFMTATNKGEMKRNSLRNEMKNYSSKGVCDMDWMLDFNFFSGTFR
jgi:hypothetical protein